MTSSPIPALLQAQALFRAPRGARPGPEDRLPEGMLALLRIVAGEEQAVAQAQASTGESVEAIREAAGFYIQQVMFGPNGDSYRTLGVDRDASDERIREHFRWLARWLHPDRNSDDWENIYADRVNHAWQHLRTPDRRLQYDQGLADSGVVADPRSHSAVVLVRAEPLEDEDASSLNLRWLPKAIFAGLGVSALATVVLFYMLRYADLNRRAPAEAPAPTIAEPDLLRPVELAKVEDPATESATTLAAVPVAPPSIPVKSSFVPVPTPLPPAPRFKAVRMSVVPSIARSQVATMNPATMHGASYSPPPPASAAVSQVHSSPVAVAADSPDVRQTHAADPQVRMTSQASAEETDANRVLGDFSQAYVNGNLDGMRAMFTSDVSSPFGGLGKILANYGQLFENSRERSLVVSDVSWFVSNGTLTIIASYQATVTKGSNQRLRRTHGDLRLDLRREDAQWRIYRLMHDERPG